MIVITTVNTPSENAPNRSVVALRSATHPPTHRETVAVQRSNEGCHHVVAVENQKRDCTQDRKSTRLNSSHVANSYAVFCLKKKTSLRLRAAHERRRLTRLHSLSRRQQSRRRPHGLGRTGRPGGRSRVGRAPSLRPGPFATH